MNMLRSTVKPFRRVDHAIKKCFLSSTGQQSQPILNFNDPEAAYKSKSTFELLRSYVVFKVCLIRPLVVNAEKLLRISRKVLGDGITDSLLRSTFFGHFCAGEVS